MSIISQSNFFNYFKGFSDRCIVQHSIYKIIFETRRRQYFSIMEVKYVKRISQIHFWMVTKELK